MSPHIHVFIHIHVTVHGMLRPPLMHHVTLLSRHPPTGKIVHTLTNTNLLKWVLTQQYMYMNGIKQNAALLCLQMLKSSGQPAYPSGLSRALVVCTHPTLVLR